MKKEFLEGLGLSEDAIRAIQAENGKDVENAKAKFADYDDLKARLLKAEETIKGFGDVDEIKASVEKYKAEAENARTEGEKKIARLERMSRIKDFTNSKKFVNSITRDSINGKLLEALESEESRGMSLDDLFRNVVGDATDILLPEVNAKPPVQGQMSSESDKNDGLVARARAVMGLKASKE